MKATTWDHKYQYNGVGGYGLGQWTNVNTSHGRCYNLHTWVTANGYADGNGNGQLAFVMHENYWTADNYGNRHASLSSFLATTSTDLDSLTAEWLACWEGCPNNALSERQDHAETALNYIKAHQSEASTATWVSKNAYLTNAETLNNCLCVYQFLTNGTANVSTSGTIQIFKAEDAKSIEKYGLLQYYEEVNSASYAQAKANAILKLYNRKSRKLTIKDAWGDIRVRGGSMIPVTLDLGDYKANSYFLVKSVTHKFGKDYHKMDLELEGAYDE